jgi:pimeloyl-ACP methyl ester carboxylesterase
MITRFPENPLESSPLPESNYFYHMAKVSKDKWESGEKSGPVSIGSHTLHLYASGPDRKAEEPVAIIIQGLATSIKAFAAVRRLITPFIRTYSYDRTGFGKSDTSSKKPTSITIAAELNLLLQNAEICPPYILVAHSWGGILAREFIALRPNDVAGLVLVDANQEHKLGVLDWRVRPIRVIKGDLDHLEVTGVCKNHKLTIEEWREYQEDENSKKHQKQAFAEWVEYAESFKTLVTKRQLNRTPPFLGDQPICVVMGRSKSDYEKLYAAGVKAGNGSEQDRAAFLDILKTWEEKDSRLQMEQLSLSSNSRSIVAKESGHNVHLTQPEVVAEATRWVFEECLSRGSRFGGGLSADSKMEVGKMKAG